MRGRVPDRGVLRGLGTALALLAPALAAGPASAQDAGKDTVGEAERTRVGEGVYTEAQAERGERVFAEDCAECHVESRFRGAAFLPSWDGAPVSTLFTVIRSQMPFDNPGSLEPAEYADVIAYIFRLNGFPAGEEPLPTGREALRSFVIDAESAGGNGGGSGGGGEDGRRGDEDGRDADGG